MTTTEGTWVGIIISAWLVLVAIVWLVRTCKDSARRKRLMSSLCCVSKTLLDPPSSPPVYSTTATTTTATTVSRDNNPAPPVYYTPPPAYHDVVKATDNNGGASGVNPDQPKQTSRPHCRVRPMQKSRSTVSMVSLSLATIEEDADETGQTLADVLTETRPPRPQSSPNIRSISYPDRLASLACSCAEKDTPNKCSCLDPPEVKNESSVVTLF